MAPTAACARTSGGRLASSHGRFGSGTGCGEAGAGACASTWTEMQSSIAADVARLIALRMKHSPPACCVPPIVHEHVEPIQRLHMVEPIARNEDGVPGRKLGF